jgi:hypothetical protein
MHQLLVPGRVQAPPAQEQARDPSQEEEAALQVVEAVAQELALGSALVEVVLEVQLALELVQMSS